MGCLIPPDRHGRAMYYLRSRNSVEFTSAQRISSNPAERLLAEPTCERHVFNSSLLGSRPRQRKYSSDATASLSEVVVNSLPSSVKRALPLIARLICGPFINMSA